MILAIDPGNEKSAFVIWDGSKIVESGILPNDEILDFLYGLHMDIKSVVIEMIASYGMPVGETVFQTCLWIGRFQEAVLYQDRPCELVKRQAVKLHLCHSARAKDSNIRQAIIDRLGAPGTKKNPGVTYGIKADEWAALALAITFHDTHNCG